MSLTCLKPLNLHRDILCLQVYGEKTKSQFEGKPWKVFLNTGPSFLTTLSAAERGHGASPRETCFWGCGFEEWDG